MAQDRPFYEKRAVLHARKLANHVLLAKEAAQKARGTKEESKVTLYNAFTTLVGEYSRWYTDVVSARDELSDAKGRSRWFRGREAVRKAKRRLVNAEAKLQGKRLAIHAVSEELVTTLDRFVRSLCYWRKCNLAVREAEERAKSADMELKPRDRLLNLIYRQNGLCGICDEPLPENPGEIHVDHIRPRSNGGTDVSSNLQAAHWTCNLRKGADWPPEEDSVDSDEDYYFTPEIREILAQRGIGFPADEEPTPYVPGPPNRDTVAAYEAARREREDLRRNQ